MEAAHREFHISRRGARQDCLAVPNPPIDWGTNNHGLLDMLKLARAVGPKLQLARITKWVGPDELGFRGLPPMLRWA